MNLLQLLSEIKARAEKATPGPWKFTHSVDQRRGHVAGPWDICFYNPEEPAGHKGHKFDNFTFIAHARTDIPKLLAALEKCMEQRNYFLEETLRTDLQGEQIPKVTAKFDAEIAKLLEGV